MHYLYILFSKTLNRFYVGETSDLELRLEKHSQKHYKYSFSAKAQDWKLIFHKKFLRKEDAVYLEQFIKRMKSKKFTQKIIEKPEILDDILHKK